MSPKAIEALVPKARAGAKRFLGDPSVANARPLVLMVEHLGRQAIPVDFFTYNRYCEAQRVLRDEAERTAVRAVAS